MINELTVATTGLVAIIFNIELVVAIFLFIAILCRYRIRSCDFWVGCDNFQYRVGGCVFLFVAILCRYRIQSCDYWVGCDNFQYRVGGCDFFVRCDIVSL